MSVTASSGSHSCKSGADISKYGGGGDGGGSGGGGKGGKGGGGGGGLLVDGLDITNMSTTPLRNMAGCSERVWRELAAPHFLDPDLALSFV